MIKFYSAFFSPVLDCTFAMGIVETKENIINLKVDGDEGNNKSAGRSPVSHLNFDYKEKGLVFFDNARFFLHFRGKASSVEISCGDEKKKHNISPDAPWGGEVDKKLSSIINDIYDEASIDWFVKNSQLYALAIALSYTACHEAFEVKLVGASYIRKVAEAFRKSNMGLLGAGFVYDFIKVGKANFEYGMVFDLLCAMLDHGESTKEICLNDFDKNGESYWYYTNMGHYLFCKGEVERADVFYVAAAKKVLESGKRNVHFNNGVLSWRSQEVCRELQKLALDDPSKISDSPNHEEDKSEWKPKLIHLVGSDSGYFEKYGNLLISSSLRSGADDVLVYVVVANPTDVVKETLADWSAVDGVHVEYEFVYPDVVSKPYYTCIRFFKAPDLIKKYNAPLFVTDIDMAVKGEWVNTLDKVRFADVGYVRKSSDLEFSEFVEPGMRPWDVPAGSVFIKNTDIGYKFSVFVSEYLRKFLDFPDESYWYRNWGIDQVALRKGLMTIVSPSFGKGVNLSKVPFLVRPSMSMGGKDKMLEDYKSTLPQDFDK